MEARTFRLTTVPSGHSLTRGQMGVCVTVHDDRLAGQSAAPTTVTFWLMFRNQVNLRVCTKRGEGRGSAGWIRVPGQVRAPIAVERRGEGRDNHVLWASAAGAGELA